MSLLYFNTLFFNFDIVIRVGWSCFSILILSSMLDDHFFSILILPFVLDDHVFQFWYCHRCWMIMFFNFDVVINAGWSCFSMYSYWYEIKFVCFVLFDTFIGALIFYSSGDNFSLTNLWRCDSTTALLVILINSYLNCGWDSTSTVIWASSQHNCPLKSVGYFHFLLWRKLGKKSIF